MDLEHYVKNFREASDQLDKDVLAKRRLEAAVGIYQDSVFLKLYKESWANPFENPLTAESRIFFSVWINDAAIRDHIIFYNIHALKLRKLKGYKIESRKFADTFRKSFRPFQYQWKNVSVDFGPLTLMEGSLETNASNLQHNILELARNFLEIEHLVDEALMKFRQ